MGYTIEPIQNKITGGEFTFRGNSANENRPQDELSLPAVGVLRSLTTGERLAESDGRIFSELVHQVPGRNTTSFTSNITTGNGRPASWFGEVKKSMQALLEDMEGGEFELVDGDEETYKKAVQRLAQNIKIDGQSYWDKYFELKKFPAGYEQDFSREDLMLYHMYVNLTQNSEANVQIHEALGGPSLGLLMAQGQVKVTYGSRELEFKAPRGQEVQDQPVQKDVQPGNVKKIVDEFVDSQEMVQEFMDSENRKANKSNAQSIIDEFEAGSEQVDQDLRDLGYGAKQQAPNGNEPKQQAPKANPSNKQASGNKAQKMPAGYVVSPIQNSIDQNATDMYYPQAGHNIEQGESPLEVPLFGVLKAIRANGAGFNDHEKVAFMELVSTEFALTHNQTSKVSSVITGKNGQREDWYTRMKKNMSVLLEGEDFDEMEPDQFRSKVRELANKLMVGDRSYAETYFDHLSDFPHEADATNAHGEKIHFTREDAMLYHMYVNLTQDTRGNLQLKTALGGPSLAEQMATGKIQVSLNGQALQYEAPTGAYAKHFEVQKNPAAVGGPHHVKGNEQRKKISFQELEKKENFFKRGYKAIKNVFKKKPKQVQKQGKGKGM